MAALPFLSIFIGAGLGATLRWWFGLALNPYFATVPLGTLASNLLGGYLIGIAAGLFAIKSTLAPEARLFVITGFLGGLTTFSSFSSEVVTMLARDQLGWALASIGMHLLGSLSLTALGMLTIRWALLGSLSL